MNFYFTENNFKILQKHINTMNIKLDRNNNIFINCPNIDCNICPFFVDQCIIIDEHKLTEEQINTLINSNPELFI
jgi:hypothetical protein